MEKESKVFIKGKLNKSYDKGQIVVFKDAEISITEGKIYHVTSASKKGKSSLLRIMSNVEYNDIYTLGFFVKTEDISYMPPKLFYYRYMTVLDYIDFHADINVKLLKHDLLEVVHQFKLNLKSPITELSMREQMLLNLFICLSQEKKLYVIDEPFLHILNSDISPIKALISKRFDPTKTIMIATEHPSIMTGLSTLKLFIQDTSRIIPTSGGDSDV